MSETTEREGEITEAQREAQDAEEREAVEEESEPQKMALYENTDLTFTRELTYEEYAEIGLGISRMYRAAPWWVGDWVNYGEDYFGEKFAQAVAETGLANETIMNYSRVARRVPRDRRTGEPLTFSHHEAVASLEPEDQLKYLEQAVEEGLTRDELRAVIREEQRQLPVGEDPDPVGGDPATTGLTMQDCAYAVVTAAKAADEGGYVVPTSDMEALADHVGVPLAYPVVEGDARPTIGGDEIPVGDDGS